MRARVLVIYKPEDEEENALDIADAVCPLGFEFVRSGRMAEQHDFQWLGFEWRGAGIPNEIEIVTKVKASIADNFKNACVLFNPHPGTVKDTKLAFENGRFEEIRH